MVNEYKYLGYWLTTKNSHGLHIRKMTNKVRKMINAIWGIWKRAKMGRLSDRLYVTDAIVKAGCMYGVGDVGANGKNTGVVRENGNGGE